MELSHFTQAQMTNLLLRDALRAILAKDGPMLTNLLLRDA
jgi:hypothetical protein